MAKRGRGLEEGSARSARRLVAGPTTQAAAARRRQRRGRKNASDLPPLTEDQILTWADAHRRDERETGPSARWARSRRCPGNNGETWTRP